ncbi:MAG: acyl transferase [Bacteroidetes bacterium]|nr:acyl transferase [Bacteroidota bacterium]MBL7105299.1 acyl transferase [Bacteroidales bacterium]
MKLNELNNRIFNISSNVEFNDTALKIFQYQYIHNPIYKKFVNFQQRDISKIDNYEKIPFLPIEFFKTHRVLCENQDTEKVFLSSGTTGSVSSKHYITNLSLYDKSFIKCFELFYGKPNQYCIIALLPSYLERESSSLVYMADKLIRFSDHKNSGFYKDNYDDLVKRLKELENQKTILLGVSFALLDLAENFELDIPGVIVMETGGMKGRRKEKIREELHDFLCKKFHVEKIHSEYGMTELLSQAYSKGNGIFRTPPWMKVLIRDTNDPKTILTENKTGGINIIDLANIYSCSFIATQDLGKLNNDGSFEVLGRFDTSDIRGCNLMIN